jgi:hypothetical protein
MRAMAYHLKSMPLTIYDTALGMGQVQSGGRLFFGRIFLMNPIFQLIFLLIIIFGMGLPFMMIFGYTPSAKIIMDDDPLIACGRALNGQLKNR